MTPRVLAGFGSVRRYSPRIEPGAGCDLQWLADELNRELGEDPYDVPHVVSDFFDDEEIEYDADADGNDHAEQLVGLMAADPKVKAAWMKYVAQHVDRIIDRGYDQPHSVFYDARVEPPGQWYWHFTRADYFNAFTRGATFDELAYTHDRNAGAGRGDRATKANCAKNLGGELGTSELVFGFGVADRTHREHDLRMTSKGYGYSGILFQSDCVVTAEHAGDGEREAIFLTCSDYNNVPFMVDRYGGTITAQFGDMTEDGSFPTFKSLLAAVKTFLAKPEAPVTARALGEAGTMRRKWLGKLPGRSRR